ncbi:MAG: NUDIX domain-containing protein [Candidatus Peribacteraceae bacterium]|nr:NUDIX domain-containing protein [Candidatus Peribacteraceae bacterium]
MIRHFTATAFIVDSKKRTLLLWHKRLQRWMPPGGHIDDNETPEDAAKRECKEETNLDVEIVGDPQPDLFTENTAEGRMLTKPIAMLLEEIPASAERSEPAHQHMDFLFVARPLDETQAVMIAEAESDRMRWFGREEIEALDITTEIFANVKAYIRDLLA